MGSGSANGMSGPHADTRDPKVPIMHIMLSRVLEGLSRAGIAGVPRPLYLRDPASPYWMTVLTADRAVYLKYNDCVPGGGFGRLAARALAFLRDHPNYRLIVDLRGNGGGSSEPFESLVTGIVADPALNQRGRVFGLVNQFTFSAAVMDLENLRQDTNAVLIGQPNAMPTDSFGNDQSLRLPYSGPTVIYTTAAFSGYGELWGLPDITVTPTVRQVLAGADPVLAAALTFRPGQ